MFAIAFWRGAAERAVKTFVQSFVATLLASICAVVSAWEVPWETALSACLGVAVLSTVLSLATSIGNADSTAGSTTVQLHVDAEALVDRIKESSGEHVIKIDDRKFAADGYSIPDAHDPTTDDTERYER